MIEVSVIPPEIPLNRVIQVQLVFTNRSGKALSRIRCRLDRSSELSVLEGGGSIRIQRMRHTETCTHSLTLKASELGVFELTTDEFLCYDSMGTEYEIQRIAVPIQVIEFIPPQLEVAVEDELIFAGVWCFIHLHVKNTGAHAVERLTVRLSGLKVQNATQMIEVLSTEGQQSLEYNVWTTDLGRKQIVFEASYFDKTGHYYEQSWTNYVRSIHDGTYDDSAKKNDYSESTSRSVIEMSDGRNIQTEKLSRSVSEEFSNSINTVLLVTVNRIETEAILKAAHSHQQEYATNITYYDLGEEGGVQLYLVRSGMGTTGPAASTVTISEAIDHLEPTAIILTGIAFGVDPREQEIGQVLISEQVFSYGPQRSSTMPNNRHRRISRGDRALASPRLIDRFRDGEIGWTESKLSFGLILSGDMLIDNVNVRDELIKLEPEAIGGEMEAAGLYSIAVRKKIDWIVVKAICDWADGNKGENKEVNQKLAARSAANFIFSVIRRGGLAD